jgi:hypothetical protein
LERCHNPLIDLLARGPGLHRAQAALEGAVRGSAYAAHDIKLVPACQPDNRETAGGKNSGLETDRTAMLLNRTTRHWYTWRGCPLPVMLSPRRSILQADETLRSAQGGRPSVPIFCGLI